jgi:hypothetical protein
MTCFDQEDEQRDVHVLCDMLQGLPFQTSAGGTGEPRGTIAHHDFGSPRSRARWVVPPQANAFASLRKGVDFRNDVNHLIASNSTAFVLATTPV